MAKAMEAVPAPPMREKPRVHFDCMNKDAPKGIKDASIDDEVMVMVRGKLKSISQYEDSTSFAVECNQIEVVSGAKPKTMTDALNAMRKKG